MRTRLHNILPLVVCFALASTGCADSPPGFTVVGISHDGSAISRTEELFRQSAGNPASNAIIHVYRLSDDKSHYELLRKIEHVHIYAPNLVVLTTNAEFVVTFDSSGQIGMGNEVVVVYDNSGKPIRKWTLEQILDASDLAQVPRTVSSRWWRTDVIVADGDAPKIMVLGPKPLPIANQPVDWHLYAYTLDLIELKWAKAR